MAWTVAGKRRSEGALRGTGLIRTFRPGEGIQISGATTVIVERKDGGVGGFALRLIASEETRFLILTPEESERIVAENLAAKIRKAEGV